MKKIKLHSGVLRIVEQKLKMKWKVNNIFKIVKIVKLLVFYAQVKLKEIKLMNQEIFHEKKII